MARISCAHCGHERPPDTRECPHCGTLQLAGGRRIVVGRRPIRKSTGKRIRRVILVVLALALLAWLAYLEWTDPSMHDVPQAAPSAAPGEP